MDQIREWRIPKSRVLRMSEDNCNRKGCGSVKPTGAGFYGSLKSPLCSWVSITFPASGVVFPVSFALPFLAISLVTKPFWNDTAREETDLLRDILTLTNPNDYIFDC